MLLDNQPSYFYIFGKESELQDINSDFDSIFLRNSDKIFAASTNAGGPGKRKQTEEIRDESGLGSGAGVTSDDASINDMDGSTGPGSDRKGNKMPGEDGITSITDAIADAIDRAEDDNDDAGRNTSRRSNQ